MKKYFLLLSCFGLSAVLAQSQTQSGASGGGQAAQPGTSTSQQQSGVTQGQQPGTAGQINSQPNLQPGAPATGTGATGAINDPAGAGRVPGVSPGGVTNTVPFGGTNQVGFGSQTPDQFINDPSGANSPGRIPFGGTNQTGFGTNPGTIQDPSGAAAPGQANPAGAVLPNSTAAADAAFAQQLNAALSRGGATRIFFPQTRSTITLVNQNGSILLTGVVADEAERQSIEARVKSSPDVNAVKNELRVANPRGPGIAPTPPTPGTENQRQLLNP